MQIREGGFPILQQKLLTLILLVPATAIVIIVVLLRPVILIRFGALPSLRIGPYAGETDQYLCERDVNISPRRTLDFLFNNRVISNHQLSVMWKRALHISRFAKYPYIVAGILPRFKAHLVPISTERDIRGLIHNTPPHISFNSEEEQKGQKWLREAGVPESKPYVCFFARDSAYLETELPNIDWSYHDYRDSSIHDHVPAAEEMVRRGNFAIRMGSVVKEPLMTTNPMIIDYASESRTDFLDMYINAQCRFFIGDPSGVTAIPKLFRRPLVFVNTCQLEYMTVWGSGYLLIPKKLWLKEEGRFMTFRETFESGVGQFGNSKAYDMRGIELVDNTPEEITAVAIEMDERLKGTWQSTDEDQELQRRFWSRFESLFQTSPVQHGALLTRIGAEFLRQNRELLD